MTGAPATRYAKSGDLNIAYQVVGDGPRDLVFVPGFVSHLDLQWADPAVAAFLERLASFARLIIFDKRGTGLSDPAPGFPTLEERMDDLRAVMDAAGSGRASIFGYSEGGLMSVLYAATYPERMEALVLFGTYAGANPADPGWSRIRATIDRWGEGDTLAVLAPTIARGEIERRLRGLFERAAASPGMVRALVDAVAVMDITAVLPAVRARTLVLHRTEDVVPLKWGRAVADGIPGARFVELPGRDHMPWVGNADSVVDEIEQFVTGVRHGPPSGRVLATLLFTDIVGSTERAAKLGDMRWRELLGAHGELVRREVARYGGREIDSAGDGFLSLFDGPTRAIRCAQALIEGVRAHGLEIRAGVHTGECELVGESVRGLAVHIGARVAAAAGAGEVLVSSTVRDLAIGSRIGFADRGVHTLKGVPGEWRLYSATEAESSFANISGEIRRLDAVDRVMTGFVRRAPLLSRQLVRLTRRQPNRSETAKGALEETT